VEKPNCCDSKKMSACQGLGKEREKAAGRILEFFRARKLVCIKL
jgi:hypothetical protein